MSQQCCYINCVITLLVQLKMKEVFSLSDATHHTRKKRAVQKGLPQEEIDWSDIVDNEFKEAIFAEAIPFAEMIDAYIKVIHVITYNGTFYRVNLNKHYPDEYICYVVVDKLDRDDAYIQKLANDLSKIIKQRRKDSLLHDIRSLARKKHALLSENDTRTIEDIEKELIENLELE